MYSETIYTRDGDPIVFTNQFEVELPEEEGFFPHPYHVDSEFCIVYKGDRIPVSYFLNREDLDQSVINGLHEILERLSYDRETLFKSIMVRHLDADPHYNRSITEWISEVTDKYLTTVSESAAEGNPIMIAKRLSTDEDFIRRAAGAYTICKKNLGSLFDKYESQVINTIKAKATTTLCIGDRIGSINLRGMAFNV